MIRKPNPWSGRYRNTGLLTAPDPDASLEEAVDAEWLARMSKHTREARNPRRPNRRPGYDYGTATGRPPSGGWEWCDVCAGWYGVQHTFVHHDWDGKPLDWCRQLFRDNCACIQCHVFRYWSPRTLHPVRVDAVWWDEDDLDDPDSPWYAEWCELGITMEADE